MRLLQPAAIAAVCSIALAACGGGGGTVPGSSAVPNAPTSVARKIQSTCNPDSYGYCLVNLSTTHYREYCPDSITHVVDNTIERRELYHYSTDMGTYTHTIDNCLGSDSWDPGDPRDVTGDPNLP
jgi:hypothetical protein